MAGTLLHITLAEEMVKDDRIPDELRSMLSRRADDFLLGSVLFDLPYFEGLLATGVNVLLQRPLHLSETGTTLHSVDPVGLLEHLLRDADDESSKALALGAVTHYSVDLIFHPAICEMVAAQDPPADKRDALHKRIEDQVDLHVSYDILGHSGVGTPYVTQKLALVPHPRWTPRFCEAAWTSSCVRIHPRSARRWLRRLHLFGLSLRPAHSPFVVRLPDDDPALLEKSLDLASRALSLGVTHLLAAHRVVEKRVPSTHLRQVLGSRRLTDGLPTQSPGQLPDALHEVPSMCKACSSMLGSMESQNPGRLKIMMKKNMGLVLAVAVGIAVATMSGHASAFSPFNPGKAMPEAIAACQSDSLVTVAETRWYWAFLPTGHAKDVGFIFYQGAFIDERAYAPVIRALAEAGYPSFILKLPHDFAMTAPFLATYVVRDFPQIRSFAVGGHSVGGVVATIYCNHKDNADDKIDGLALWSSYPSPLDTIANQPTKVVSIWGTLDGLTSAKNIEDSKSKLPADATFVTIEGGNHAQFGSYGDQDGDNAATISRDEQQDQVVEAMLDFLASLE